MNSGDWAEVLRVLGGALLSALVRYAATGRLPLPGDRRSGGDRRKAQRRGD
jgi:hypothetical protein